MTIGVSSPQYWLNDDPSTKTLKSGVYCSDGEINVTGEASGTVTFAARKQISFSGPTFDFRSYQYDVVAYSRYEPMSGEAAITVSSGIFQWEGILLATKGPVHISTSTVNSDSGSIIGDTVRISASSGTMTALELESDGPPRLVE